jgi:hypothetical protein
MAKNGGYRKPSRPAPVSGPGRLSQRTDGGPTQGAKYIPGGQYGEGKALMQAQTAAPMAGGSPAPSPLKSLLEAGNPDTPLTQGLPYGPGAGPEVIPNQRVVVPNFRQTVERLRAVDDSGEFDLLAEYLDSRGI